MVNTPNQNNMWNEEIDETIDLHDEEVQAELNGTGTFFDEEEEESEDENQFPEINEAIKEMDFSEFSGKKFKESFAKAQRKVITRPNLKRKTLIPRKPLTKLFGVANRAKLVGGKKKLAKVIVPNDRKVIIEGVSKFILSNDPQANALRNIGYYKGKKLQELVLNFNNDSALDFTTSLFNPSVIHGYLYSTSLDINDRIQVAGGSVLYTDVLYNILANPVLVRSCKVVISGPQATAQAAVSLQVQDKYINGVTEIVPVNLSLQIDTMQVEGNTISFDINSYLKRPFIPDGMDVINYTILAGNTVTMCFYYEQKSLKKLFYKEAREKRPKRF